MVKSFVVFALLSCLASAAEMGDILILSGTSTSGKSTIAENILSPDGDRLEEDLDLRFDPREQRAPEAQLQMIDDVIDQSLQGQKTLVHMDQAHTFLDRLQERQVNPPVRSVLIFCQMQELVTRLESRNEQAKLTDLKNIRDPLVAFDQYSRLYTRKKTPGKGLETLHLSGVTEIYKNQFDKMIAFAKDQGNSLPSEEQISLDKQDSLTEFLNNLGFEEGILEIEVDPRYKESYHLVLDNTTVEQTAENVILLSQHSK